MFSRLASCTRALKKRLPPLSIKNPYTCGVRAKNPQYPKESLVQLEKNQSTLRFSVMKKSKSEMQKKNRRNTPNSGSISADSKKNCFLSATRRNLQRNLGVYTAAISANLQN